MSHIFGDEFLDLDDVLKERARLLQDNPEDVEHWDYEDQEYLAEVASLEDQLWTSLTEYARNVPTMIRDSAFEDYARSFASDVEGIDLDGTMAMYVDWEDYADDLKNGYHEYTIGGFTYYGRDY